MFKHAGTIRGGKPHVVCMITVSRDEKGANAMLSSPTTIWMDNTSYDKHVLQRKLFAAFFKHIFPWKMFCSCSEGIALLQSPSFGPLPHPPTLNTVDTTRHLSTSILHFRLQAKEKFECVKPGPRGRCSPRCCEFSTLLFILRWQQCHKGLETASW